MEKVFEVLAQDGLLPLVTIDDVNDSVLLAKALSHAGLHMVEVGFRTDCAAECIRMIKAECPSLLVGAGTIHTLSDVDEAVSAGSDFLVSAGLDQDVLQYALQHNRIVIPGVCTPGDIETALNLNLHVLKFFPAEVCGGTAMLKALQGPYEGVQFMPSGGIHTENLPEYLNLNNVCAVSGSWLAPRKLIQAHRFHEIERIVSEALEEVSETRQGR